jgi:hypothetical protein
MNTLLQLVPSILVLILILFYVSMFRHMLQNITISNVSSNKLIVWPPVTKNNWIIIFVLLNVFAAGYYYMTEYKNTY